MTETHTDIDVTLELLTLTLKQEVVGSNTTFYKFLF